MPEKKLYVVEVTHKAYVWAESWMDAEDFAAEIVDTEDYSEVSSREVTENVLGWDPHSLVYHESEEEISLGEVFCLNSSSSDNE